MNNRSKTIVFLLICIILMWKTYSYYSMRKAHESVEAQQAIHSNNHNGDAKQVKITVYYEALCSDSRNFVLRELLPTYLLLSKNIVLDLVPYGKATTIERDGHLEFQCQHGHIECLGNKVHACTIEQVQDPLVLLQMIACMIDDNIIPFDAAERCAKQYGVSYADIADCANSPHSSALLDQHGIRTNMIHPSFIPTVELNNEMKVPLSVLLKDLKKQVELVLGTRSAV